MKWYKRIICEFAWRLDSLAHRIIEWCEGYDSDDINHKFYEWLKGEDVK